MIFTISGSVVGKIKWDFPKISHFRLCQFHFIALRARRVLFEKYLIIFDSGWLGSGLELISPLGFTMFWCRCPLSLLPCQNLRLSNIKYFLRLDLLHTYHSLSIYLLLKHLHHYHIHIIFINRERRYFTVSSWDCRDVKYGHFLSILNWGISPDGLHHSPPVLHSS